MIDVANITTFPKYSESLKPTRVKLGVALGLQVLPHLNVIGTYLTLRVESASFLAVSSLFSALDCHCVYGGF